METKLLEEKIDALNANLEKIIGLMDRLGGYSKLSLEQAIEQRVDDLKIKKETLEETIRHNKAMENYKPFEDEEYIEIMKKAAIAAKKGSGLGR